MRNIFGKQNGFTFIELIIVLSVLSILSVVGIAAFSSYASKQNLNIAAADLAATLNLAKSRAYSQVKPTIGGCDSNNLLDGYEVRICGSSSCISTGKTYEVNVKCGGSFRSPSISSVTAPNLTFTPPTSFFFPVLKGGVAGGGQTVTITNAQNNTKSVTVDESGNIKINAN